MSGFRICIRILLLVLVCGLGTGGFPEKYFALQDDEHGSDSNAVPQGDSDLSSDRYKRFGELSINQDLKSLARLLSTHQQRRRQSSIRSRLLEIGKRGGMYGFDASYLHDDSETDVSEDTALIDMSKEGDMDNDFVNDEENDSSENENSNSENEATLDRPQRNELVYGFPNRKILIYNRQNIPGMQRAQTRLLAAGNWHWDRQKRPSRQWRWRRGQRLSISGALTAIADMLAAENRKEEIASNRAHLLGIGKRSAVHRGLVNHVPMAIEENANQEEVY